MLDGIVDTPYTGQLVATGGLAPLAWTVTAGAMPSGLTLNATTGAITGSPTATPGTYSFTAHVTDASSPQQAASQQLSITVEAASAACSSSGNNSLLVGQYAFDLRGYNGSGFLAVVGSFTADGNGNITTGEADTNGGLGRTKRQPDPQRQFLFRGARQSRLRDAGNAIRNVLYALCGGGHFVRGRHPGTHHRVRQPRGQRLYCLRPDPAAELHRIRQSPHGKLRFAYLRLGLVHRRPHRLRRGCDRFEIQIQLLGGRLQR